MALLEAIMEFKEALKVSLEMEMESKAISMQLQVMGKEFGQQME
jgi:hypothetical protein